VLVPNLQIGNRQGKLQLAKQHSQAELGNERTLLQRDAYRDVGSRTPTVGTLGDAWSSCRESQDKGIHIATYWDWYYLFTVFRPNYFFHDKGCVYQDSVGYSS
jgi:hypothetical protein